MHFGRQQRPVTDAGRYENNIPLLQPIPFLADQIFGIAGIAAEDQLVKGVAVKLKQTVAVAAVTMSIRKAGGHFQLLIKIVGVQSQLHHNSLELSAVLAGGRKTPVGSKLLEVIQLYGNPPLTVISFSITGL